MPIDNLEKEEKERIRKRAKKARERLGMFRTYKSDKRPFEGSLGVGISAIKKRKKRIKEMEAALGL